MKAYVFRSPSPLRPDVVIYAEDTYDAWLELQYKTDEGEITFPDKEEMYEIISAKEV